MWKGTVSACTHSVSDIIQLAWIASQWIPLWLCVTIYSFALWINKGRMIANNSLWHVLVPVLRCVKALYQFSQRELLYLIHLPLISKGKSMKQFFQFFFFLAPLSRHPIHFNDKLLGQQSRDFLFNYTRLVYIRFPPEELAGVQARQGKAGLVSGCLVIERAKYNFASVVGKNHVGCFSISWAGANFFSIFCRIS